jgi:uncharacterized protein YndB with AHSA1/START domain
MFELAAEQLLDRDPAVERGRMFNATGLKTAGKFFAFPHGEEIVLKLPAERVEELVTSGAGNPFDAGKGRPMREWVSVRPDDRADCAEYMLEARNFLAADGYSGRVTVRAPRERVFDALATLEGPRGWWTPLVTGSAARGGELHFAFEGVIDKIVMRVDVARRPSAVHWSCVEHSGHPEWVGTQLAFYIVERGPEESELRLRHIGLVPELDCYDVCERGWMHFLPSIAAYVERGQGSPFTAAT